MANAMGSTLGERRSFLLIACFGRRYSLRWADFWKGTFNYRMKDIFFILYSVMEHLRLHDASIWINWWVWRKERGGGVDGYFLPCGSHPGPAGSFYRGRSCRGSCWWCATWACPRSRRRREQRGCQPQTNVIVTCYDAITNVHGEREDEPPWRRSGRSHRRSSWPERVPGRWTSNRREQSSRAKHTSRATRQYKNVEPTIDKI